MKPNDLPQNLGQTLGLPDLKFSEWGASRLEFGNALYVDIEHGATNRIVDKNN